MVSGVMPTSQVVLGGVFLPRLRSGPVPERECTGVAGEHRSRGVLAFGLVYAVQVAVLSRLGWFGAGTAS